MKGCIFFVLLILVSLNSYSQGDILHIESIDKGVLFPRSSTDPMYDLQEGMIYFNTGSGRFKVYNGSEWRFINDDGRDGINGSDAPQGPSGPQGDHVWYGLACWDINGNGIFDVPSEDKNNDLKASIADCEEGANGASGSLGDPGLPYKLSKQATSGSCVEFDDVFLNGKPDLVILHTYRWTDPTLISTPVLKTVYNNGKWSICSADGSALPINSNGHYDMLVIADLAPN